MYVCNVGLHRDLIIALRPVGVTRRLHGTIVGPTGRPDPGYIRLVGQTSRTDRSDRL